MPEGYLRIIPPTINLLESNPLLFEVDNDNQVNIVELLIGSYIVGVNKLKLTFSESLDMAMREQISRWIRKLPGFEILEEHTDSLTISDTSEKQVITPILRRQFSTTKYMLTTLVNTMDSQEYDQSSKILDRDEDVDRHRYFVERLCHLALQNPSYARKIDINPSEALHYSLAAKYVERIADHICEATQAMLQLPSVSKKLRDLSKDVLEVFETTTKTFFAVTVSEIEKGSKKSFGAEDAFASVRKTDRLEETLERLSPPAKNPHEILLILHLGRIVSYCADIGEVAINRMIEAHI